MTPQEYLSGFFDYTFSDQNYSSIFKKRGVTDLLDVDGNTTKSLELSQADLYMVMFTVFSKGSASKKKGSWSQSDGGAIVGVTDRKSWFKEANRIYGKYGEAVYSLKNRTQAW
jgi:hypothetical protein